QDMTPAVVPAQPCNRGDVSMTVRHSAAVATMLAMCIFSTADADPQGEKDGPLNELVIHLGSDDAKIRRQSAQTLQTRRIEAEAGMGGLTGLSNEDDSAKLDRFRTEAKPLISALVNLLQSPYEESRVCAARALGAVGPDAAACRTALRKIVRDKN